MNLSTHITLVVDHSGSMGAIAGEAESAVNAFIQEQKNAEGFCTLKLYEFASFVVNLYEGDIQDFDSYGLRPAGMTALNDAIGKAIDSTGAFLRNIPAELRPEKVIFVVMTDGQENASKEYTPWRVKEMVKHQTDKYNWEFVFLGAGLEAARQAGDFGFDPTRTVTLQSNTGHAHTHAYSGLSSTVLASRGGAEVTYGATYDADGNLVNVDPKLGATQ